MGAGFSQVWTVPTSTQLQLPAAILVSVNNQEVVPVESVTSLYPFCVRAEARTRLETLLA